MQWDHDIENINGGRGESMSAPFPYKMIVILDGGTFFAFLLKINKQYPDMARNEILANLC